MAKVATVSGATGFVGSEVVRQLLDRGYTVRATVRSLAQPQKTEHLQRLAAAAPGRLELFEADLLQPGSFDAAVAGAAYVFHVASPFTFPSEDLEGALIRPAVEGTRNVMQAAGRSKDTVRRVVVTSSCAAVYDKDCKQPRSGGGELYTEQDWNETSKLEDQAYWLSKVLAERAALEVGKEEGLEVLTICPNFIMGPPLSAAESSGGSISIGFMKAFLQSPTVPSGDWTLCDVRDVALAHILAAEAPEASGRYIVSQPASVSAKDITDLLKAHFPKAQIPDGDPAPVQHRVDGSKAATELGLELIPWQKTLTDMADQLIALGVVKPSWL